MKKHPLHHENNTRVVEFKCQMLYTYKRNAFKQVSLQFDLINRRTQDQKKMKRHLSFFLTLTVLIIATSKESVITTLGDVNWPGLTLIKRHQRDHLCIT